MKRKAPRLLLVLALLCLGSVPLLAQEEMTEEEARAEAARLRADVLSKVEIKKLEIAAKANGASPEAARDLALQVEKNFVRPGEALRLEHIEMKPKPHYAEMTEGYARKLMAELPAFYRMQAEATLSWAAEGVACDSCLDLFDDCLSVVERTLDGCFDTEPPGFCVDLLRSLLGVCFNRFNNCVSGCGV